MANYDVESHRHGTEICLFIYFWHPTHARTTRYEEAFLPEGKKRPHYYMYFVHRIHITLGVNARTAADVGV